MISHHILAFIFLRGLEISATSCESSNIKIRHLKLEIRKTDWLWIRLNQILSMWLKTSEPEVFPASLTLLLNYSLILLSDSKLSKLQSTNPSIVMNSAQRNNKLHTVSFITSGWDQGFAPLRLSIRRPSAAPDEAPVCVTSWELSQVTYGRSLVKFRQRFMTQRTWFGLNSTLNMTKIMVGSLKHVKEQV